MSFSKKYILDETIQKLNNYELMVFTTEHFTQFLIFLRDERNYKNFKIRIGNFEYDDWKANIYSIIDNNGNIYFKHIRDYDKKSWQHKTLTEQLIYAWGFNEIKFNINFDIINNLWNILNDNDKNLYDSIYDDTHEIFW